MSEEQLNPTPTSANPEAPKATISEVKVSDTVSAQPAPSFALPKATPPMQHAPEAPKASFELPKSAAPKVSVPTSRSTAPIPPQVIEISSDKPSTLSVALDFVAAAVAVAFAVLIVLDI